MTDSKKAFIAHAQKLSEIFTQASQRLQRKLALQNPQNLFLLQNEIHLSLLAYAQKLSDHSEPLSIE